MRVETLENQIADTVSPVIKQTRQLFEPYSGRWISRSLWLSLLTLLFPVVSAASRKAGEQAREFYDAERERVFPGAPRHDFYLPELTLDQFVKDMEEVRARVSRELSTPEDVQQAALRVARSIENTARWTVIKAVSTPDPYLDYDDEVFDDFTVSSVTEEEFEERKAQSYKRSGRRLWARVATGRETCGWCLMLCSRGPVYGSQADAGGMHAWHAGCDCKVVPVFDLKNWTGRERYKAAEAMWKKETRGVYGKDAINAMRSAARAGKYKEYLSKQE